MSEHPLVKEWLSQLQANGYRITHARRVIVEELVKSQKALEPVDLFTICRKKDPALGLVTIYRTLDQLDQLGLIQRVHQADGCHTVMRSKMVMNTCWFVPRAVERSPSAVTTLKVSPAKWHRKLALL